MNESIFKNSMVDMSYTQIEKLSGKRAPVLIPISVMEEHGPHLCTGVDMYLTQCVCKKIQDKLGADNIETIIAPPFYWGVNSVTNGFTGSFCISEETANQLLYEIIQNFEKWEFKNVFFISFHGDFKHMKTIAKVALRVQETLKIQVHYLADQKLFYQLGYKELPACFAPVNLEPDKVNVENDFLDVHAGANETSWMLLEFPELVDIDLAKQLEPTNLTMQDVWKWSLGGSTARQLTPLGYCGNPANVQLEKIQMVENEAVTAYTNSIKDTLHLQ